MPRKPSSKIIDNGDGTASVELSQGMWATIDVDDIPLVAPYKWHARKSRASVFYAARCDRDKSYRNRSMHAEIAGTARGLTVDHIDGDGLNNRRANLRMADARVQGLNRQTRSDCKTGVTGVDFRHGKWQARITVNKRRYSIGYYNTMSDAAFVLGNVKKIVSDLLEDIAPSLSRATKAGRL